VLLWPADQLRLPGSRKHLRSVALAKAGELMSGNNGKGSGVAAVRISTFMECVKAAHLSSYVQSEFQQTAGMFIVGPPGVMKTTILRALDSYESVLTLSDVNSKVLHGIIKSEGFSGASFEDPTVSRFTARALVIGAMTDKFRDDNWQRWNDSGFARRFLWCLIRLGDPSILMNAVEMGRMAMVQDDVVAMPTPPLGQIPALESHLRKRLRSLVRKQPKPSNVQYELLCRMAAVLDFYYKRNKVKKDAIETLHEFGGAILNGAELTGLVI
jgi:hypothetical protein